MASSSVVLESAEFVVNSAQDVSIPSEGIESLASILVDAHIKGEFKLSNWTKQPANPKPSIVGEETCLAWIIVVDTLNFCFWHPDPDAYFAVDYKGSLHRGYMSLCALINRAMDESVPIFDPHYISNLSVEQAQHLFRSSTATQIPQFEKRIEVLRELGSVLLKEFEGDWKQIVKKSNGSALAMVELVTSKISSYDDKCEFGGREVYFRKRAQILVADIWACFEGLGFGSFSDIDAITMFADYRVPQSLVYFGAIKYSDRLLELLRTNPFLEKASREECEIRAASIWSVELVRKRALELLRVRSDFDTSAPFNAIVIDFYLWDYAKAFGQLMNHIPIHKTMTIFY
jgi:hypothetical protein